MGRSGRRPVPQSGRGPGAPRTGSRKRKVEPLSPQSSSGTPCAGKAGEMVTAPPAETTSAPNASRQRRVASMSAEELCSSSTVGRSARAAQMARRWASDLEEWPPPCPRERRRQRYLHDESSQPALKTDSSFSTGSVINSHFPIFLGITRVMVSPRRFLSDRAAWANCAGV